MNRPYVVVNVAMSADGKIDTVERKGATLSSAADKARLDRLRAEADAVLVGGRTLLDEDPMLTVKSLALRTERKAAGREENPIKVGIVTVAKFQAGSDFISTGPARKFIYTTGQTPPEQIALLEKAGARVFVLGKERVDLEAVLHSLHEEGVRRLMVEGGGTLIAEFFRLGLVDELMVYITPRIFGGETAPTLADGPGFLAQQAPHLRLESVEKFDEEGGVFIHYYTPR